MANVNFKQIAMTQLGFSLADVRNLSRREQITELAAELKAEATRTRETDTVRQSTVAGILGEFEGFANDPQLYGPTCAEVHEVLLERGANIKRNAVAQHLAKLRTAGYVDSARKMETDAGKRGAPPVFFFLVAEASVWSMIEDGELVAN